MSAPAPVRIWRDPTKRDVEELLAEQGMTLSVRHWGTHREYWAMAKFDSGKTNELLARVQKGARPDWRAMLQQLGSDWA